MERLLISIVENTILSSVIFLYLVYKAKVRKRFLYTDNIFIIVLATVIGNGLYAFFTINSFASIVLLNAFLVIFLIVCLTLVRFYRDPERRHSATDADILSPADGFIVYIKQLGKNEMPFSIKGKTISKLQELTKTSLLETPCWLIGITMTLFDVHITRAPTDGSVILNEYFRGKFLSLKQGASDVENERSTIVFQNKRCHLGVVQIASKRVRGIETFIERGEHVKMGQRIGAIRFGSQTDIILPDNAKMNVRVGQWVYGGKTVIATLNIDKR